MKKGLLLALIVGLTLGSCEKKTAIEYPDCLDMFGEFEPNIADDEYSEIIWFAVDPKGDSFEIHADDFKDSSASFGRMCFCADGGFHWINEGCIYGKKTGEGKWEVSIVIKSETNFDTYTRMIRGNFLASL